MVNGFAGTGSPMKGSSLLRIISLDFDIRRRYGPAFLVEKDFLDVLTEKPCNLDSQGETRIVPARLDGIDRLAGDAHSGG
jgi:hypothetical protein